MNGDGITAPLPLVVTKDQPANVWFARVTPAWPEISKA